MKRKWIITLTVLVCVGVLIMSGSITPITKEGFGNIETIIEYDHEINLINNTAAETTLHELTIPRLALGYSDRMVHLKLMYMARNNSGSPASIVWRAYYGASAAVATPADTWATSTAYRYGVFHVWLMNVGDTESQKLVIWDDPNVNGGDQLLIFENSKAALNLKVTIDFSAADVELLVSRLSVVTTRMQP